MKRRLLVLLLCACIALTLMPATAMAASSSRDGLTVTLTTNKSSFAANSLIGIDASVTNTNNYIVRNVRLDIILPSGLMIQSGGTTGYMTLSPGRTVSISSLAALRNPNPNIPQTGESPSASVWVGVLLVAAGAGVLLLVLKGRKRNEVLAALLCLALLGGFLAPISAHAATVTKSFSVSQPITVGGKTYTLQAELTYDTVVSGGGSQSKTYTVKVNGGSGGGSYKAGQTVTITAGAPETGMAFAGWTVVSGEVTLADALSATTTFTMPSSPVEVTATYVQKQAFAVTVNNGTGSANYFEGDTVTITADTPDTGMSFAGWVVDSGGVTLADASSTTTTFTMPSGAVEVRATYAFSLGFNSNGNFNMVTKPGGVGNTGGVVGESGYSDGGWYFPTMTIAGSPAAKALVQVLPADMVLTDLDVQCTIQNTLNLTGLTACVYADIYYAPSGSDVVSSLPAARVTLTPNLSGVVSVGTELTGTVSGLNITLDAGDQVFLMFYCEVVAGMDSALDVLCSASGEATFAN